MARRKQTTPADEEASREASVPSDAAAPQQSPDREPGDEPSRLKIPNPFAWITDVAAGVQFRTVRDPYQAEIHFQEGKPTEEVRQIMKEAGFRWNPPYEAWTRPIGFHTAQQDRLVGERTAREVIKMIREEKGLAPSDVGQSPF